MNKEIPRKTIRPTTMLDKMAQVYGGAAGRAEDATNFSLGVAEIAEAFDAMLRAALRSAEFSDGEWKALYNAYASHAYGPMELEGQALPQMVRDALQYDTLTLEHLGVDVSADGDWLADERVADFLGKVESLTPAERIAVVHKIRSFWRLGEEDAGDVD